MFLDLRYSTAIAERLGNLKFSALVRDFFSDLTYPVIESKGQVSHYIGDEAVLTWKMANGLQRANCLRWLLYDARKDREAERSLRAKYGLVPEFKAGAHAGTVVTTEVGEIKSEIVYHGDVVNTTARIQGLCDTLGASLLISADLAERLGQVSGFQLEPRGAHVLKGKEQPVSFCAVEEC